MSASNLQIYNRADVAAHYAVLDYLTPCEQLLFDQYIKPGDSVLDLGVGGGRTSPYLSCRASSYVGVDYSSEMIRVCRKKYPSLEFLEAEASNLSAFEASSFDAVVIAFNGLDYVIPDKERTRCLSECRRVLKPDGILLFSSHNPRAVMVRPDWNRERVTSAAKTLVGSWTRLEKLAFGSLSLTARARALLRAAWCSADRMVRRVPTRAFWRGEGYIMDSAHGGLLTHCWVPERLINELLENQFYLLRVMGDDYPLASHEYTTDWYYYVFSKSDISPRHV